MVTIWTAGAAPPLGRELVTHLLAMPGVTPQTDAIEAFEEMGRRVGMS